MSNSSYSNDEIIKRATSAEEEVEHALVPQNASRSLENLMNLWELADNGHRRFLFQALAVRAALAQRKGEQS